MGWEEEDFNPAEHEMKVLYGLEFNRMFICRMEQTGHGINHGWSEKMKRRNGGVQRAKEKEIYHGLT